jgi:gluconolactonase
MLSVEKSLEWSIFAEGFNFPEGPAFDREGNLCLVNLKGGYISRIDPAGQTDIFAYTGTATGLAESAPNGSTFHPNGDLYVADSGRKAILAIAATRQVRVVCDNYQGEPFQAPNDLCFDRCGGLYFSDPPPVANRASVGRLFYLCADGTALLLDEGIAYSNGVALDKDEKYLYLAETRTGRILRYQVQGSGKLGPREVFAALEPKPDGLAFDLAGNLYVAVFGSGHIWVVGPDGAVKEKLALGGDGPTNLAFGGPERRFLYITEGPQGRVYRIEREFPGLPLVGEL